VFIVVYIVFLMCFKEILHLLTLKISYDEFLSSAELKERYFEERMEPNSCLAPLTSIENTMEVKGAKVPIVLQNIFLCVQQKK